MPSSRLQLRPLRTLLISVEYALRSRWRLSIRYSRDRATVRFFPPIFIMANFFYGFSATRHLAFYPYLPTPQVTLSLLFAGSEIEGLPHHTPRGKLHIYDLLFTSIQNYTHLNLLVYRENIGTSERAKVSFKTHCGVRFLRAATRSFATYRRATLISVNEFEGPCLF